MKVFRLMTFLGVVAFSGTTLASGYGSSSPTTQLNLALSSANQVKQSFAEHLQAVGVPPSSLEELGIDEGIIKNEYVNHFGIDPFSNAILLGLSDKYGQNKWAALIPEISGYQVTGWVCQTMLSDSQASSDGCRGNVPFEKLTSKIGDEPFQKTLASVWSAKVAMLEHYYFNLKFPRRLDKIGIDEGWMDSAFIDYAIIEPKTSTLLFGLSDIFGKNHWLSFTPKVHFFGMVTWTCKTTLPISKTGVTDCNISVPNEQILP